MSDRPRARQSQLVTTYGVGSLFPHEDQSFMICGIDEWDEKWARPVEEPRLARSLGVHTFKAPPTGRRRGDIPVIRFPEMHYCPKCRRLDRYWKFGGKRDEVRCAGCDRDLTPSRFVACCENGHIEEFPYFQWLHKKRSDIPAADDHRMRVEARGTSSSLSDIVLSCSCGVQPCTMDGAFDATALREIKWCAGRRLWLLGSEPEECGKPLRAFQRGSSNVWFPVVRSSISIPPWSGAAARFVSQEFDSLKKYFDKKGKDGLRDHINVLVEGDSKYTAEDVLDVMLQRLGLEEATELSPAQLRDEEYQALLAGNDGPATDSFRCLEVPVAKPVRGIVTQVCKVSRLREVRALAGFSRVTPTEAETSESRTAKIYDERTDWLPATEVLGEGIFVRLDPDLVNDWTTGSLAQKRQTRVREAQKRRDEEMGYDSSEPATARFLVLHTLAHILLKELSLDAGYPMGSLRERVYADEAQSGILIYTASSDSAGSLGGLAALGEPDRFGSVLTNAVNRASWCSNDPVCTESGASGADGLNLAACHACVLLAETSCEHRNQFLDRVTIVGSFMAPDDGIGDGILKSTGVSTREHCDRA